MLQGLCDCRSSVIGIALAGILAAGCASLASKPPLTSALPAVPNDAQIRVHPYVFITDADVTAEHPLLKELQGLQDQVCRELELPPIDDVVKVYLFRDRERYERYMNAHFRDLPSRRAFFMANTREGRGDELVVYTYWGDRVQEDLRHELTHALLHGVLKTVPMWLDEGLAEHFEVPPSWNGVNYRHLKMLRSQRDTWTPNLARLEEMTEIQDMNPADYRESWAWVHFMLNDSSVRRVLIEYLHEYRTQSVPSALHPRLLNVCPAPTEALANHLKRLETGTRSLAGSLD